MRTTVNKATLRAGNQLVRSAPVQKENRLFTFLNPTENSFLQRHAQIRCIPLKQFLLHVHDSNRRERFFIEPVRKPVIAIFTALCKVSCCDVRGRRPQNKEGLFLQAAEAGHLSGIIAWNRFRTIAVLLFLVDDYKTEIWNRGKNCTPRSDYQPGIPSPDTLPLVIALTYGQSTV